MEGLKLEVVEASLIFLDSPSFPICFVYFLPRERRRISLALQPPHWGRSAGCDRCVSSIQTTLSKCLLKGWRGLALRKYFLGLLGWGTTGADTAKGNSTSFPPRWGDWGQSDILYSCPQLPAGRGQSTRLAEKKRPRPLALQEGGHSSFPGHTGWGEEVRTNPPQWSVSAFLPAYSQLGPTQALPHPDALWLLFLLAFPGRHQLNLSGLRSQPRDPSLAGNS